MKDFECLFDKDTVETISNLVEKKMHLLNKIPEFKKKDQILADETEKLEGALSQELNEQLDNVMRLHYEIDSYYYTLAYFLGKKQGEEVTNL